MKFRLKEKVGPLKVGPHYIGNKKYVAGQVIESDRPLDVLCKGKFERVPDDMKVSKPEIVKRNRNPENPPVQGAVVATEGEGKTNQPSPSDKPADAKQVEAPQKQEVVEPPKSAVSNKKSKHGVDVTDEFPDASIAKMKVFHSVKDNIFSIVDPESDEALKKSKGKNAEKAIAKFLKSQV